MGVGVHIYMFQVGSGAGFPAVSPSRSVRHRGSGKAGKTAPPALWPGGSCWRPPARWLLQTACPLNDSSWTEYCGTQRPSRSFQLSCTVLSGLCSHIPVHCNPPRTAFCLQETDKYFRFRLRTRFYILRRNRGGWYDQNFLLRFWNFISWSRCSYFCFIHSDTIKVS